MTGTAKPPLVRTAKVSKRKEKIERERIGQKVEGTRRLARGITKWLDALKAAFFERSGLGAFREADGSDGDDNYDADDLEDSVDALDGTPLAAALSAEMRRQYGLGAASAAQEIVQEIDAGDFDLPMDRALRAIDAYALKFATSVTDREKAALKRMIRAAIDEGISTRDLAAEVADFMDDGIHTVGDDGTLARVYQKDAWAEMVARTEVARANNAGAIDLYRAAKVATLMWLTAEDERVCPECNDLDGEVVPVGQLFDGEYDQPPAHPACRCTVVSGDDEAG